MFKYQLPITVLAISIISVLFTGCAGMGALGNLANAASGNSGKVSATADAAKKSMQIITLSKELTAAEAQRQDLVLQVESQKAKVEAANTAALEAEQAATTSKSQEAMATSLELRKQATAEQEKLQTILAEQLAFEQKLEEKKSALADLKKDHDMYGTAISHNPSERSVDTYTAMDGKEFALATGKYAIVGFSFNRQVPAKALVGTEDEKLVPGMLNDTNAFWVGQKLAISNLVDSLGNRLSEALPGVERMDQQAVSSNAGFQKAGSVKPVKILGMEQPFDWYIAPGFGYFDPQVASKLAEAATALGADYLVNLAWSATYAAYDGDWKSGKVQLKLALHLTIHDKTGKIVTDTQFDALSQNKAGTVNDEIYPEAIGWLAGETAAAVWAKVIAKAGK